MGLKKNLLFTSSGLGEIIYRYPDYRDFYRVAIISERNFFDACLREAAISVFWIVIFLSNIPCILNGTELKKRGVKIKQMISKIQKNLEKFKTDLFSGFKFYRYILKFFNLWKFLFLRKIVFFTTREKKPKLD